MTDLNELMKQAKQMKEQMQKAQEDAKQRVVIGESGAGLVRVHMNGSFDASKVELSPEVMQEDKEIVEDLVAAAINDAVKKLEDQNRDALSGLASGFKMPDGFKFPF